GGGGEDKGTRVTTDAAGARVKNEGTAVSLTALRKGSDECPGAGVKDGTGAVQFDVTGTKGCYDIKATMGEKPTKAHIHQGAAGVAGPVVVDLMPAFTAGESAFEAKSC